MNNEIIRKAINLWFLNEKECIKQYGHISNWDTINVTDMSNLFKEKKKF